MRGPHNLWRLIRTGATFERTGAMRLALEAFDAPPALRIMARVLGWPFQWLGFQGDPSQPPILRALTALGPAYIKFGQLLSTRPDVVGPELAAQLTVLQDKLPPFSMAEAREAVEHELGQPLDAVFADFAAPVAAASLAQVHRATLQGDRPDRGGEGAAAGDRARLPARRRRLLLRRRHGRAPRALRAAAAAEGGDPAFRGGGAGRARPPDGGGGRRRVRRQHRARRRLPRALGGLAGLRAAGADAGMGERHQPRRPPGAAGERGGPGAARGADHPELPDPGAARRLLSRRHAPGQPEARAGRGARRARLRHHGADRRLHPAGLCRDPDRLPAPGLCPRRGGALRGGLRAGGAATATPSPRRCARWASRSSATTRRASRWRGCSRISSR